jgi:hypothetical protein
MTRMNGLRAFLVAAMAALAMLALPAVAGAKDRNHDRIPDRWEKRHRLSLHKNQARRDQDRDHLRNRAEYLSDNNPRDADSDNDGIEDGDENAGTIQAFNTETGELTIGLFGGSSVTGLVTEDTEIECDEHPGARASGEDGDAPSDHEEPAGEHEGDEPGEHEGDEPGEHEGDEPGEHEGDQPGRGSEGEHNGCEHSGDGGDCSAADLVEGVVVREAELHLSNGRAVFEEIELAG